MAVSFRNNLRFILLVFFWPVAVLCPLTTAAPDDEFIELTIPLEAGQFYSRHDFYRESNRKLGTQYELERIDDRRMELTPLDRVALLLANETGLMRISITSDKLVVAVPNSEDERVRRRHRQRLGRLLNLPLADWPKDKGLHLPEEFSQDRRTILLVHGLEADASGLQRFEEACRRSNVQTIVFDYPNDGPVAWSGDRLRASLEDLVAQHERLRLAIVAHSMGGLVARHALETGDHPPASVTHLFMLGTPNHGTKLAGAQGWLELAKAIPKGQFLSTDLMQDGLGEGADDLSPDSQFLRTLNANRRPEGVPYFNAIGRRSFFSERQRSTIEAELDKLLKRQNNAAEVHRAALDLLASDEIRDGHGDGAVSVASARLADAEEQLFDLNHVQLVDLPGDAPEKTELFRWIMRKLDWVVAR